MSNKTGIYSLRMSIITAFASLFIFLIALIIGLNYYFGKKSSLNTSETLFEKAGQTAIHKTADFLQPAMQASQLFERMIHKKHLSISEIPGLQSYCIEVMNIYPQFSGCFFGSDYGLWGTERSEDPEAEMILLSRWRENATDLKSKMRDSWVDKSGKVVRERDFESDWDTRTRPWYVAAKKDRAPYWSDPYLFFNANDNVQIGISAAMPVINEKQLFTGATLIDITIKSMADFLKNLKISPSSLTFIIDENGKMVCFPFMEEVVIEVGGDKRLRHITEMDNYHYIITSYAEYCKTKQERVFVDSPNGTRIVQYLPFPASFGKNWRLVITALESDFTAEVKKNNQISILISLAILFFSTVLISIIARNIAKPINTLTGHLDNIRDLKLTQKVEVNTRIAEINHIADSIESLRHGLLAFKKYVPEGLVKDLVETGETARIGGKNEFLTIFFSDIKNFTTISEGLPPEYLGQHLSEYLDEMSRIIVACGGTIDKYIGDAIMAFWGAPHKDLKQEYNACRAALLCQKRLKELDLKWASERKPVFHTRIGIHTGPTVVGNIGSSERMNYTVIGDSVNLASRLEGVNKIYSTGIIISQTTAERVKDDFLLRPLDCVQVKGKAEPIEICELMDELQNTEETPMKVIAEKYTGAYSKYRKCKFIEAKEILTQLLSEFPDDGPAAILMKRVEELIKNPPSESEWNGICNGLRSRDIC
jgi:adenylate cyclase